MCLRCALGLQILPCASQHRGPVNINGNGNQRRLLPAPGAGRANKWGQGLLHAASQLSACCLQPAVLSLALDKASQAWFHTASPHSCCLPTANSAGSSQNPVLAFCRGEEGADPSPSLALGRAGMGVTTLSSSSAEILLFGRLQQWLHRAASSHYQTVINTNKRDELATVG